MNQPAAEQPEDELHEVELHEVVQLSDVLRLRDVLLHECQVHRGAATQLRPGNVEGDVSITAHSDDAEVVLYLVRVDTRLHSTDEQLIAHISITFAALYDSAVDSTTLPEKLLAQFSKAARLDVHPYVRELLASLTTRMGLPTVTLPVLA